MDRDRSRRGNSHADLIASDSEDRDGDFGVRQDDLFADFAREDEHASSSVK